MTNIFVQFSDSSETAITAVFGCPQDPAAWPNQGSVSSTDARYSAYYGNLPAIMQRGMIAPGA